MKLSLKKIFFTILICLVINNFFIDSIYASDSYIKNWALGQQKSVTPIMDDIVKFNHFTQFIMFCIVMFVLILVIYIVIRFRSNNNPKPSNISHNTTLEILWTIVPIIILVIIAVPSFKLLYKELKIPKYYMTVKVTGNQWYWTYDYPDQKNNIHFDSYMVGDPFDLQNDLKERLNLARIRNTTIKNVPRLLSVDNEMIVPVNKNIRLQITATDVIHSFAMPSMGIKLDAIPGRLNETWVKAKKTGVYYGQCSELCGSLHAFMPLVIRVVTIKQYKNWIKIASQDLDKANNQLLLNINN